VRRALERRTDIETEFIRTPVKEHPKCDFYLAVDDGRDDIDWIPPRPNAFWAVDTHLGPEFRRWKAEQFDRVYVAQQEAAKLWSDLQISWLPLGCDPEYHPSAAELEPLGYATDVVYDCVFVGHINQEQDGNNRLEYLDTLFGHFPNSWFAHGLFHHDMASRYIRGRIGFNVSIKRDLNMRVFELMSIGVPMLTNNTVDGIDEVIPSGLYVGYENARDMVLLAEEMLANYGEMCEMARKAQQFIRAGHTYGHRVDRILSALKKEEEHGG